MGVEVEVVDVEAALQDVKLVDPGTQEGRAAADLEDSILHNPLLH